MFTGYRQIQLEPCEEKKTAVPGVYLYRDPRRKAAACKVRFTATWVDREKPGNSYTRGDPLCSSLSTSCSSNLREHCLVQEGLRVESSSGKANAF